MKLKWEHGVGLPAKKTKKKPVVKKVEIKQADFVTPEVASIMDIPYIATGEEVPVDIRPFIEYPTTNVAQSLEQLPGLDFSELPPEMQTEADAEILSEELPETLNDQSLTNQLSRKKKKKVQE